MDLEDYDTIDTISMTPELVEALEYVLAMAYNYASTGVIPDDDEWWNKVVDAHEIWVQICTQAGGEADSLE